MKIAWSAILARVAMRRQSTPGPVNNMDGALSALGTGRPGPLEVRFKNGAAKPLQPLKSYPFDDV
jgi:hypothetical protein